VCQEWFSGRKPPLSVAMVEAPFGRRPPAEGTIKDYRVLVA
jgi:hypothetical protein